MDMKIVVLDGHTLNPGDLSWEALESMGDCKVHDRTFAEKIIERTTGAEIVFTNKTPLDRATLEALPDHPAYRLGNPFCPGQTDAYRR